jgi:hypothetical protein
MIRSDARRLTGGRSGAGGFAGTLYDGGYVLADLRDKAHTLCASQAGAPRTRQAACLA